MLIASLRDVIRNQASEMESLRSQLQALSTAPNDVRALSRLHVHACVPGSLMLMTLQKEALQAQITSLSAELQSTTEKRQEVEKEQEDLLVLLDELNGKRRRDKQRMREAGMEVSEDEAGEGDDDEDEE